MPTKIQAIERIKTSTATNLPRIQVEWTTRRRRFFSNKYAIEKQVARLLLIPFSPVIGSLWCLVKLTSPGPGFYRQLRVGMDGREFYLYKLRSMRVDAEGDGQAIWSSSTDDRFTWPGKILRRLHLDELPQLFNVARGEMSLIGPRPERPPICAELAHKIEGYYDRVTVKPGISGLSQVNLPSDESLDDVRRKQRLDMQYINETTVWLEIRILLASALRMAGVTGETTIKLMKLCRRHLLEVDPIEQQHKQPVSWHYGQNTARPLEIIRRSESEQSSPQTPAPKMPTGTFEGAGRSDGQPV